MEQRHGFELNGRPVAVEAPESEPLLYVLRDRLGMKGTRFGCGRNQCGACSVLVDGRAAASCDTPVWAVAGRSVTTVEGLGTEASPHPVQRALLSEQAGQCGYCLSGVVVHAAALLARNPRPTEQEVRAALDGCLCRCGAHNRIVRAVLRAAEGMP